MLGPADRVVLEVDVAGAELLDAELLPEDEEAISPSQNTGAEMPKRRSPSPRGRRPSCADAEMIPMETPMINQRTAAPSARDNVLGARSMISCLIAVRLS